MTRQTVTIPPLESRRGPPYPNTGSGLAALHTGLHTGLMAGRGPRSDAAASCMHAAGGGEGAPAAVTVDGRRKCSKPAASCGLRTQSAAVSAACRIGFDVGSHNGRRRAVAALPSPAGPRLPAPHNSRGDKLAGGRASNPSHSEIREAGGGGMHERNSNIVLERNFFPPSLKYKTLHYR